MDCQLGKFSAVVGGKEDCQAKRSNMYFMQKYEHLYFVHCMHLGLCQSCSS